MGQPKTKDGKVISAPLKSFADISRSFVTPDYCRKDSWFYDVDLIVDEVATDAGDHLTYDFASGVTIVNLKYVTDRADWPTRKVVVKKNDVVVTSGFAITYNDGAASCVTFTDALDPADVVKVSYAKVLSSDYVLTADAGKSVKINYVESQFSVGAVLNDTVRMELILNNPATGGNDYVANYSEYQTAADYFNKANHGVLLGHFGELTKDVMVFPWDYQTGICLKPVGDATTNPYNMEFNKLRVRLLNDLLVTECEVATGTFYVLIDPL